MNFYFIFKEKQGRISGQVPSRMTCSAEQGTLLAAHRIKLDVVPELGAQLLQPEQLRDVSKRAASPPSQRHLLHLPSTSLCWERPPSRDGGQEDYARGMSLQ